MAVTGEGCPQFSLVIAGKEKPRWLGRGGGHLMVDLLSALITIVVFIFTVFVLNSIRDICVG